MESDRLEKHNEVTRDVIESQAAKEISTTARWGISILATLLLQTAGVIWWASGINSEVHHNTLEIERLKSSSAVILTRQQLDDILSSRDQRLDTIEKALNRIDSKLDAALQ